jgi:hypothetical protein
MNPNERKKKEIGRKIFMGERIVEVGTEGQECMFSFICISVGGISTPFLLHSRHSLATVAISSQASLQSRQVAPPKRDKKNQSWPLSPFPGPNSDLPNKAPPNVRSVVKGVMIVKEYRCSQGRDDAKGKKPLGPQIQRCANPPMKA